MLSFSSMGLRLRAASRWERGGSGRSLSEAEWHELDARCHALQRQLEEEILPLLTAEQRRNLATQIPLVLRPGAQSGTRIAESVNAGF